MSDSIIVGATAHKVRWVEPEFESAEEATEDKGYPHPGATLNLPGGHFVPMQYGKNPTEERNGVLLTEILRACARRLEVFNTPGSPMACRENACARTKIEEAIHWLDARQIDRAIRKVQFKDEA